MRHPRHRHHGAVPEKDPRRSAVRLRRLRYVADRHHVRGPAHRGSRVIARPLLTSLLLLPLMAGCAETLIVPPQAPPPVRQAADAQQAPSNSPTSAPDAAPEGEQVVAWRL